MATVNSGPGACGDATHVCQVTTNAKGLVTAQSAVAISGSGGGTPGGSSGQLQYNNAGAFGGFTAGGDLTFSQPNFTLATVNTNLGACGDSTHYPIITLNAKGLTTACSTGTIPSLSNTPLLTASNTYTSGSSSNIWQGSNGYVQIATGTNALVGVYAGTGATASAFYFSAQAGTTPSIDIQVGSTIYSGTTASGCSSFVAGICVASGSAGGTVSSIATSGPISGGTITTSGTISCSTCLTTAGGWTVAGATTFSSTTSLHSVAGQSLFGRVVNIEPSYQDEVALNVYGYTGGTQDLLDTYNQVGGTKEFWVTHTGIVDLNNEIGIYNGMVTQGMGVPPVYYTNSATGVTSYTGIINITCGGSICPAGTYRISLYVDIVSAGGGNGQIIFDYGFTDATATRSYQVVLGTTGSPIGNQSTFILNSNGSAQITYWLNYNTYGSGATWDYYITLERLM